MRLIRTTPVVLLLLLSACGSMEVKGVQSDADRFIELLARGDFNGAYEMCDPDAVSHDVLMNIANNPEYDTVLNDFQGLDHSESANVSKDTDGKIVEIRLPPTEFVGHEGWKAQFAFRRENNDWKIIAFEIKSPAE